MDSTRWERIQTLFHEVLTIPEDDRKTYLETACGGDTDLLTDVMALLESDAGDNSILDLQPEVLAAKIFDGSVPDIRTIGPYRIKGILGKGGMGVVYLGEHEQLNHLVAVKVLRDASLSSARRERFIREQQVLAQLVHPAIARLYEAGVLDDGTPYFAMEFVAGIPITQYCSIHGYTIHQRLRLFRSVCEAVQYAHGQAIIHRDLKPSNIFARRDGSISLLDFGIAKQLEELDTSALHTRTGLRLMTPSYAAPEQLLDARVGVFTDVYGLGVLLYELLAGQLPFDLTGLTPGQVESLILQQEPEKPSVKTGKPITGSSPGKHAWSDLDVLCLTAMHKDPQRRYASVESLIRDLDHYLRGEPLEARRDSIRYRTRKFFLRKKRVVGVTAIGIAAVIALVSFYTMRLAEQRTLAQTEAAKATQLSEYLIGLFSAGDPFAPDSGDLTVNTLLQRGIDRTGDLAGQPPVQAQMLNILGRVHLDLGQYDRADSLLNHALAIRRSFDADPTELAESIANLGRLFAYKAQNDSAIAYLSNAIDLRLQYLPPRDPELAVNFSDLGTVYSAVGEYDKAEELYLQALEIQRSDTENNQELGHTLHNLAVNYYNRGNHDEAEYYYREALAVDLAVLGKDHPKIAFLMSSLAMVHDARGELDSADSLLTEALRIRRMRLGNMHIHTTYGLIQLGGVLRKKGEFGRSEEYLKEAMALNSEMLGSDHTHTVLAQSHLALTLRESGDYTAAIQLLESAVNQFRQNLGDHHYYIGFSLCNLAEVLYLKGDAPQAEPYFREGLSVLNITINSEHQSVINCERSFGHMLAGQDRLEESEPYLLSSYQKLLSRYGADHYDTHEAAKWLVDLYEALGRPGDADRFR